MLRKIPDLAGAFREEAAAIREMGFAATKMKVGLGPVEDVNRVLDEGEPPIEGSRDQRRRLLGRQLF